MKDQNAEDFTVYFKYQVMKFMPGELEFHFDEYAVFFNIRISGSSQSDKRGIYRSLRGILFRRISRPFANPLIAI